MMFEPEHDTPEGYLVTSEIIIQGVLSSEGESAMSLSVKGITDRSTVVGLLELAKFEILTSNFDDEDDDED